MLTGIDVSSNNGHVDWARVAQAGFTFAYARATLGRESNDEAFQAMRQGAKSHGLRFGAYHLPYPGNSSAQQQAQHFLTVAKPQPGDLLPAIDVEEKNPPDTGEAKLSTSQLVAWLRAWLAAVEESVGAKPVIYTNPSWWSSRLQHADLSRHPLWLAHYTEGQPTIPAPWKSYAIWQHSQTGQIGGNAFDFNRCPDLDAVTIGSDASRPLLLEGATGPAVHRLKTLLTTWCEKNPPPVVFADTNFYGPKAVAAVKRFQLVAKLDDDGKVGPKTWAALEKAVKV